MPDSTMVLILAPFGELRANPLNFDSLNHSETPTRQQPYQGANIRR